MPEGVGYVTEAKQAVMSRAAYTRKVRKNPKDHDAATKRRADTDHMLRKQRKR